MLGSSVSSEEPKTYEPKCKVCTSTNRSFYEEKFVEKNGLPWTELEKMAKSLNEEISMMSFKRHFERHFSAKIHEFMTKEETVEQAVEKKKTETINAVDELKNNVNRINGYLSKIDSDALNPATLSAIASILSEQRKTLEACEKISTNLKTKVGLTRAELLKEIVRSASDLCEDCQINFMTELDKRLREKGIE